MRSSVRLQGMRQLFSSVRPLLFSRLCGQFHRCTCSLLRSNTITWMCGYFCLSSKPAFDAASAVSYWDLTLPSTSKPYPSTGNVLALRFLGLASSSLTCFSIIVLFKRSALKAFSFVSSLTLLSIVMFLVDLPCRALSLKRWSWLDATLNYRVIFSCQVFGQ